MKNTKKRIFIGLCVGLVALVGLILFTIVRSNQPTFNGSRTRNPDAYLTTFSYMNGNDTHTITAEEGAVFHVSFEVEKGDVDVTIGIDGETPIYRGSQIETESFNVGVTKTGTYTITVHAKKASGSINITM